MPTRFTCSEALNAAEAEKRAVLGRAYAEEDAKQRERDLARAERLIQRAHERQDCI